ncbi:hypothetical protein JKG68_26360 [Microvirga aerilata]|uniref:Uncharacterized protein n=1 Tax=Microvirga aerilata TaxID=670292 RepID=A0A937D4E6_9HYPH|nr:hypothetical protein [Microvirga aerilata]MBL0407445.1 hypothetical protein [Microvirga aerilata]
MSKFEAASSSATSNPLCVRDIQYRYDHDRGCFRHNLERDLQIFCIWENARHIQQSILSLISENFSVIKIYEFEWSHGKIEENFGRLYKTIGNGRNYKQESAGSGPFLCIVCEDLDPCYLYSTTVSGNLELCNKRVVEVKRTARSWLGGFLVHSTANPIEFIEQVFLLLSEQEVENIMSAPTSDQKFATRKEDMIGSDGWDSFESLFRHLNKTTDYLVLRNFESALGDYSESDLDVLCAEPSSFLAAANGANVDKNRSRVKCTIQVAGRSIPVDVRFVGDGYYDTNWQRDMLKESELLHGIVRIPRVDHYFFSMLYHGVLQKPFLAEKYILRLDELGREIGLGPELLRTLPDANVAATVVQSFLKASGYSFYTPLDAGVHVNRKATRVLWPDHITIYRKPGSSPIFRHAAEVARKSRKLAPQWLRKRVPPGIRSWILST